MNDGRLTIRITGQTETIAAVSFLSVLDNTLRILREIDAEASGQHDGLLQWCIAEVSLSSPLYVTLAAESEAAPADGGIVASAYVDGLAQLEEGTDRIPPYFTVAGLERARDLVSVLDDGVDEVTFIAGEREPVSPSQHLAAHVAALLPREYEEVGTVVGALEMLSMHPRPTFAVWDDFTGLRVPCTIPPEQIDKAHTLFRERVSVYGVIRYHPDGKPKRVHMKRMERLRRHDEVRSVRDMPAINITDGVDPSEYVRRLRDA